MKTCDVREGKNRALTGHIRLCYNKVEKMY
nr:MAG TPA: hypothetical protein [Caudoviricetes sp.]